MDFIKGAFLLASLFLVSIVVVDILKINTVTGNEPIIGIAQNGVLKMPVIQDTSPETAGKLYGSPIEQRDSTYIRYLSSSVKIGATGCIGSGTIIYYDYSTGEAYVASCGHLWNGSKDVSSTKNNPQKCKVIVWYQNDIKLKEPKSYDAEVLFWSNNRGYDTSLIKFRPDWEPQYFPIAPKDYEIPIGSKQHSCGCDHNSEVAHYEVEIVGPRGNDLVTKKNSPRPGRSGGGLLSDDGYYIGTCWGTSDVSGNGIGLFTPLESIRQVYSRNGYDWILEVDAAGLASKIPIRDWSNTLGDYPKDIITMPGRNKMPVPIR